MLAEFDRGNEVLGHLTLTGRAVVDATDPSRVVNGLALARPGDTGTAWALPTVDEVRGAAVVQWFRLVPSIVNLLLVPAREGLLRMKSIRDMIDLAVPRTDLQTRLRPGALVDRSRTVDLDAARRAANSGFRDGAARLPVLVVDERYGRAAEVIVSALGGIEVEVELVGGGTDPVATTRDRIAAGQQLDAVLADDTAPITDLGGFREVVPL